MSLPLEAQKMMDEYIRKKEEKDRRAEEIINLLKREHLSLIESEELFSYVIDKIKNTPLG